MKDKTDKQLLPMKAHYFFYNAGTAPVVPFLPTFARQLGYSSVVVGTIYTILPVVGMLAKPLFGYIGDRYNQHRLLFLIAELLTAISLFSIMFVPTIETASNQQANVELHCQSNDLELYFCTNIDKCALETAVAFHSNKTLACQLYCNNIESQLWHSIRCDDSIVCLINGTDSFNLTTNIETDTFIMETKKSCLYNNITNNDYIWNGENRTITCHDQDVRAEYKNFNTSCLLECDDKEFTKYFIKANEEVIGNGDAFKLYQFWIFFGLLIISWIGMAAVVSIGDAICFHLLGDKHHLYGKQRFYGSIGWGIFSIMAGVLVDKMSQDSVVKDYTAIFWMALILMMIDVLISTKLKNVQTEFSTNIFKDISRMFLNLRCLIFFIWCIFIGLCTALIWNFLLWYLEDLSNEYFGCQNSIKTLQGLAMGIQCFGGELPFFFLSGWILKKIGHVNAMSLVLFGFALRFFLYSLLKNPWYVLPIELLNGITFGIFYSTMASYASIVAPAGSEATMQGLVGAIFEGIGVSVGSLVGGILFDSIGGRSTFFIYGSCAFVAFILHFAFRKFYK